MKLPPEQLPNPWLFDTEMLLREIARCREMVLLIPAKDAATHFATNIAIDALWNLETNLRYLLHLHREGQRQFRRKATLNQGQSTSAPILSGVLAHPSRVRTGRNRKTSTAA